MEFNVCIKNEEAYKTCQKSVVKIVHMVIKLNKWLNYVY